MVPIELTSFSKKIHRKLEFPFGTIFLCENIIVSEIKEGVLFSAEEGNAILEAVVPIYTDKGYFKKCVYIANRINKYSVNPVGWLKYGHLREYLNGYCVIDNTSYGLVNALLESKFVPLNFKSAMTLNEAITWALSLDETN